MNGGDSIHYVEAKTILTKTNGVNIYRGCTHGCIYCDSRSHCYQITHDFQDIAVKENAIELLEKELRKKRKKIMIGTGSMSDPYMHIEKKLGMTRKMLETINKYGHGVSILTKSDLVLRDLDLLKKINEKAKVVISFTLTTADETLCKVLEPHVSTTKERVEALKILHDNNIETGVWLGPILPFINDNEDNIKQVLDYCIDANVKYTLCFAMGLTLREGNREYYYQKLDQYFPNLKEQYIKYYGNRYEVKSFHHHKLYSFFTSFCKENNILYDTNEIFNYLSTVVDKTPNLFTLD